MKVYIVALIQKNDRFDYPRAHSVRVLLGHDGLHRATRIVIKEGSFSLLSHALPPSHHNDHPKLVVDQTATPPRL
ncbi:hypothetical protein B0O80DRAFT_474179, partial [Mortierella sp. GBAus27b]